MMIVTHSMEFARKVANRIFYMDAGGIYEDGTPEQIFNHPKKDLTRRFINRLSTLDLLITEKNHNLDEEIGRIHAFCAGKGLSSQRIVNACGLYEEALILMYKYYKSGEITAHIIFEYNAAEDGLTCSITPYTSTTWEETAEIVLNSLEFKLISYYWKSYHEEKTDEGAGVRSIYTL